MKKLVSLTLALMLALTTLASLSPAAAENAETEPVTFVNKGGVLSMLNLSEEGMADLFSACRLINGQLAREGYQQTIIDEGTVDMNPFTAANVQIVYDLVYFDTLDAMLMALNVGDINFINLYSTTADYLCANDDRLIQLLRYQGLKDTESVFVKRMFEGILSNDFAFMMLEGNEALRDAFNAAIADVRADGTLTRLAVDHIDAAIAGKDIAPVEMPKTDGAETVRVAITGALPPMDYIASDGTPAGFNTALLAEISQRTGKNIELVQVDSMGRAAALSSGVVDAVFWTRTNAVSNRIATMTRQEKDANIPEFMDGLTEEEREIVTQANTVFDFAGYGAIDMPEGTIITDAYYSDYITPVMLKTAVDANKAIFAAAAADEAP